MLKLSQCITLVLICSFCFNLTHEGFPAASERRRCPTLPQIQAFRVPKIGDQIQEPFEQVCLALILPAERVLRFPFEGKDFF